MYFSTTTIAAVAIMASSAAAQIQLENVASFESYSNANCSPPTTQNQNINSNTCTFLPQQSAKVFFLEKNRANCQRMLPFYPSLVWYLRRNPCDTTVQFFASSDCTGTPANVITSAPSDCIDVSQLFSYKAICS
ncbi:hypothetical protein GMOD_00003284 [Pyrenophora seminiperda CCB06]|uniref:Uncharacterized protein n=1 Tax=Pyrenophora seminiperda CCB06 TaxID=1302712 RepID=A0A3M7MIC8_9PLEO|nr:hypothetical protein GMOD_00003284 [Pyrenophora seminiperda CCB06]